MIRIIRKGDPMWIPFMENRTLMGILVLCGVLSFFTGCLAYGLGSQWGKSLAAIGVIATFAAGARLWEIR